MSSPIEALMILCDAAQADSATGKVHMLGAGWSVTRTPSSHAVAILFKIPWDRANEPFPFQLQLLDADGGPVAIVTDAGNQPILAAGNVEVGRPAGIPHGSDLDASFALNVPSLPLAPGRYQWRLDIDRQSEAAAFTVLA